MDNKYRGLKSPILIHQEESPDINELNNNISEVFKNTNIIDDEFVKSGIRIKSLIDSTKLKLKSIKDYLIAEKERQEDINILCNKYTNFSSVITLNKEDFTGNLSFDNNVISARLKQDVNKIKSSVININGNGFEGNEYVFSNGDFLNKTLDTSNRNAITDATLGTFYEYSRITLSESIEGVPNIFNKDSISAECSIDIEAEEIVNKLIINSDKDDLILSKVYVSLDGLSYKLDNEYNLPINERYERYNTQEYIFGSGIISIEPSKYIKLIFRSSSYSNDTIAFVNTFYNSSGESSDVIKKVEIVPSAKRNVIKINDISLYANTYADGKILSKELITDPVNCISLCCNEYINKEYAINNNIRYYFIINGNEYEVNPVNSSRNGKKIIRISNQVYKSEHSIYLNESIKSAKLKIVISPSNQKVTPFINNIKILIGGKDDE